jgi:ribulose-phosphate 3-epimerase
MEAAPIQIAPSVLAADFLRLGDAVRAVEDGGAERIQIDVMDGRFVPNITMGPDIVQAIRGTCGLLLEAHLMIVEPDKYVETFANAGADLIIVHQEVSPHLYRTLQHIRSLDKMAGVALNPGTPPGAIVEVLHLVDLVLVMTVNPGFGGQQFISAMLPKIEALAAAVEERGLPALIEVDGGIDERTAPLVVRAGARVLVAGTSVFRAADGVERAIASLRAAAGTGLPSGWGVRQ